MDAEQLTAIVQIITSGGAIVVMYLWNNNLRDDLRYEREEREKLQDKLEKAMQTQIEWQRWERMKDLPREDTRPIPPRWKDENHPAARIED